MNASLCENCGDGSVERVKGAVKLCNDCFFRDHAKSRAAVLARIGRND